MWSCLEISDALLLVWYGLSAFPWARSALYVDMSNVNDLRLHEANAWRAGRATPQTSAEMHPSGQDSETFSSGNDGSGLSSSSSFRPHSGRELLPNLNSPGAASTAPWQLASQPDELNGDLGSVRVNVYPQDQDVAGERGDRQTVDSTADPRPPWVAWESGMALPRPTYSTWGTRVQRPSTVRRGRKFVSVVPSAIVLGTPTIEGSAFSLTIGMPILGPNSIPRTFNEKGTEVVNARASLGVLEALGAQSARAENETSSPVGHDSRWFASWRRLRGTPRISIHGEGASSQVTPHGADIFDEETGSGAEGMRASLEALRRRISRESGSPSQSSDGILHGSRSRTGDDPLDG